MHRLLYTGTNYGEVKRLCGDRVLAPYFCMGLSMLSVDTGNGFVTVNEGDTIVLEDDGTHIAVVTEISGVTHYALSEVTFENGFFAHKSIRTFFSNAAPL